MGVNEIATVGMLQEMQVALLKEFRNLHSIAQKASDQMMTVDEVAAFVCHDRKTVLKWINEGKVDDKGRIVKLPARQFAPGKYRISSNDLLKYGEIGCYELIK